MLRIVSNNDEQAQIKAVGYRHVSLNPEERETVLDNSDANRIIPVTEHWQPYAEKLEHIDNGLRPTLKEFAKGPFHLNIANQGNSLQSSFLVFGLTKGEPLNEVASVILNSKSHDWISRTVTAIPFMDVFRYEIEREADHVTKLLRRSKVTGFNDYKARSDAALAFQATDHFFNALSREFEKPVKDEGNDTEPPPPPKPTIGREAVTDGLASALSASHHFYDSVWRTMTEFYAPSLRHLGERVALGEIPLKGPDPIRV